MNSCRWTGGQATTLRYFISLRSFGGIYAIMCGVTNKVYYYQGVGITRSIILVFTPLRLGTNELQINTG